MADGDARQALLRAGAVEEQVKALQAAVRSLSLSGQERDADQAVQAREAAAQRAHMQELIARKDGELARRVEEVQAHMKRHAGMSLPRAQSMAMIYLTEGVDQPSDPAQKLRVSKQATQQVLKELQAKNIIRMQPDPNNGRQKYVVFTDHGRELGEIARQGLFELEAQLRERIGAQNVNNLRRALKADWGPSPGAEPPE